MANVPAGAIDCDFHPSVPSIQALMPYTHTTVHAKYWSRWGDNLDIARCVRILNSAGYKGAIALEYEAGPWDGVEGATRLMKDVLAAL